MMRPQPYFCLLGRLALHWQPLSLALSALLIIATASAFLPILIQQLLDSTFLQKDLSRIQMTSLAIILLFIVRGIASYISIFSVHKASSQLGIDLRMDMFNTLLTLPVCDYAHLNQHDTDTLISRVNRITHSIARNIRIDLSEQYKEKIVDYMFNEYEKGRTHNPDVLCNREIKFDVFMKMALSLGADYVATGHYCRKGEIEVDGTTFYQLLAGKDNNKDQSYFLCQSSQEQLAKSLFPIGELTKPQVREIATQLDLVTAEKKDSQGLCFIGKVRLPEFLQQQLQPKDGLIFEVDNDSEIYNQPKPVFNNLEEELIYLSTPIVYTPEAGKVVGKHQGAHYFTIGQRKGLNVGGTKEALFIIATDVKTNTIYTGQGHNHKGLFRKATTGQCNEKPKIKHLACTQNVSGNSIRIFFMKTLFLISLSFITSFLYGQDTREIRVQKCSRCNIEIFHVLKSDKKIYHGAYAKVSINDKVLATGYYKYGLKDSTWIQFDNQGKNKVTKVNMFKTKELVYGNSIIRKGNLNKNTTILKMKLAFS